MTKYPEKVLLQRGFTLIELLVTIAIISILAAILFPVFARARESARRASCMTNLKNLALSVMMYTQDNDGKLMVGNQTYVRGTGTTSNHWFPIQPYIKNWQILYCPSAPGDPVLLHKASNNGTSWTEQYGFPKDIANEYGNHSGRKSFCALMYSETWGGAVSIDTAPFPSRICLIGETNYGSSTDHYYVDSGYGGSNFGCFTTNSSWLNRDRHLSGANYAYMDGHVKWIKKEAIDHVYDVTIAEHGISQSRAASLPIVFSWRID